MATTLNNLRENISDAINASRDGDGQLAYDTVIDVLMIEALVAVAEQLRMANLIAISNIDMAAMAGKSVQMAHTGRGTFTQDEIKETFLCENYIAFRNREDGPLDESPITMQS